MTRSLSGKRPGAALVAALITWTLAGGTHADSIQRGHVVRIEDREIYFTLDAKSGVQRGHALRIKRPIQLRHPVTGKTVQDWLPVGAARVTMVGSSMSMAVLDPGLLAQVRVGDVVESLVLVAEEPPAPAPAPPPSAEPEPPAEPLPEVDAHTREVLGFWQGTIGKPVDVRIGVWEDFLARRADSPYAAAIHEDLEILRAHRDKLRSPELELDDTFTGGLRHNEPTRGRAGEAIELAFLVDTPSLAAAWIHYRVRGSSSYSKSVLRREGMEHLRGEIPASAVKGPGVEYFVEVATLRGQVGTAVGSPEFPVLVSVPSPPLTTVFAPRKNRSRVSISTAYLDFATFDPREGDHTDAFFLFEADFLYRLHGLLYGVRTGFGVINGNGGYANRVYTPADPSPKVGFNYGYAEFEMRGGHQTAFLGRLVAGVGQDGFGVGAEARFRLGAEHATNLSLGASRLAEIGFLTEIRMQWTAVDDMPLGLAVALTDQPAQGDLGVRLTTDIGYRALSWVQPTLRISYQARNVNHAGVGAGLGLVFDW